MTGGLRTILSTLALCLLGALPARAEPEAALLPEAAVDVAFPAPRPRPDPACTPGGACIEVAAPVADLCRLIEGAALENGLDPGFFARLIWKESLFDAAAVSPAGAQGIAQFMPGTAKLRGLDDPFDPAEALAASALYLADLTRGFGNIGLAAVAYNGGEARAAAFVGARQGLPAETRAYVQAITGHSADAWRDAPPEKVDLALPGEGGFRAACIAQATRRQVRELPAGPPVRAWGVILASSRERDGAERQVGRLQNRYAGILAGEPVSYTRSRRPGMATRLYMAQVGRDSRADADALCARLKGRGADCMVLRN